MDIAMILRRVPPNGEGEIRHCAADEIERLRAEARELYRIASLSVERAGSLRLALIHIAEAEGRRPKQLRDMADDAVNRYPPVEGDIDMYWQRVQHVIAANTQVELTLRDALTQINYAASRQSVAASDPMYKLAMIASRALRDTAK